MMTRPVLNFTLTELPSTYGSAISLQLLTTMRLAMSSGVEKPLSAFAVRSVWTRLGQSP